MTKPLVAIIGRPNVGKSTLFNRLVGARLAIVEDEPGVTRDYLHALCEWNGHEFFLIDTGGLKPADRDKLYLDVENRAKETISKADLLIFLVDGKQGITPGDWEIADVVRKSGKPVILVVNKIDDMRREDIAVEFFALGLGDPFPVAALSGLNTGDLLDRIVAQLPSYTEKLQLAEQMRVAVVGRPNVGKSSLINRIIGNKRLLTSPEPGTTRDAIDVTFPIQGYNVTFVDTAGLRHRKKIKERVEYYSTVRARQAIDRSDITILVLDSLEGATDMDQRIAGYAHEAGRGLIIALNKWDLIKFDQEQFQYYQEEIRHRLLFCSYAPLVFLSALSGRNINRLLSALVTVRESQMHTLTPAELDTILQNLHTVTPIPQLRGQSSYIYNLTQLGISPPRFKLTVSNRKAIHFSYLRQIENHIRQQFDYIGTPIKVFVD